MGSNGMVYPGQLLNLTFLDWWAKETVSFFVFFFQSYGTFPF